MKLRKNIYISIIILFAISCSMEKSDLYVIDKIPVKHEAHGDERLDNYNWMRDDTRSDPKVIEYLKNENLLADRWFSSKKNYKDEIVQELLNQVPDETTSFPLENNGYFYFTKSSKIDQLSRYYFKNNDKEVLFLDPNQKLLDQSYYSIGSISPSPNNQMIAYSEDNNGRREYQTKIINSNLLTNYEDIITRTSREIFWSNDNKYIIYLKKDPVTLISDSVYIHEIGTSEKKDLLLFKESDKEFNIDLSISKTKQYLFINIESTNANEIRLINLDKPLSIPSIFIKRSQDHLYYLEHVANEEFIIRSNKDAPNFKLLKIKSLNENDINKASIILNHNEKIFINDNLLIGNKLIIEVRKNGLPEISILDLDTNDIRDLEFIDNAYDVSLVKDKKYSNEGFYYYYSSLTTPPNIVFYNLSTKNKLIEWKKDIKAFDENDYIDSRFFITARDGVQIPVVTITHKDTNISKAPILFYGYGSYGINTDAQFRESIIPLLKKGFVFAIINIRGGGEFGKKWYEGGRMFNKMNTFNDFNDGVKAVLELNIGNPKNVFARGGSAGGLLMGAIINLEPELYAGILSGVPFVDVLTTMSDPSIPLTTFEYDEWGNPANEDEYFYIKTYSPYDNIKKLNYPAVFITSSLYDSQVQYFEPAKYTAKLKEYNQSSNPILMKMNLIGGHGGLSGKINQFNEIAEEYNFILNLIK